MILRSLVVFVFIALFETIQGILRAKLLVPRVGDHRSRQIGVLTGSIIILLITNFTIDWIKPETSTDALIVGTFWFVAMLIFEFTLGHFVFRFPWRWLINEFNFLKGRFLLFGMLLLLFAPYIIINLRRL